MSDPAAIDPVEQTELEKADAKALEDHAKAQQFAKSTGGPIDHGLGGMGGAGASGAGPDIADQSAPQPGNSSDLPKP